MGVIKTDIEDVLIIEPRIFGDERGYFYESYNKERFKAETGLDIEFVQDNQSLSGYGVLRGLHFQKPPFAQSKLVRVIKGAVMDVAVDIRVGSPTYGKYVTVELTEENHRQVFIPRGFAHGFVVLSKEAILQYKCDNLYHPESEGAIIWNDAQLEIDWKIPAGDMVLSEKDLKNLPLSEIGQIFTY